MTEKDRMNAIHVICPCPPLFRAETAQINSRVDSPTSWPLLNPFSHPFPRLLLCQQVVHLTPFLTMFSQKTFRIKEFLAKKQKQNRIQMKIGNKTRYRPK
jgi:hypothetical protein